MEGNFYISDTVVDRELRSKYGRAYEKCGPEAKAYGTCVESGHINHDLERNSCVEERRALRQCVDKHLKQMGKRGLSSKELKE